MYKNIKIGNMLQFLNIKTVEERRRLFEVVFILVVSVLLLILARIEGDLYELSQLLATQQEFLTSIVYFSFININIVLVIALVFLIIRNIFKLVVERRRGVIGSHLRTKLVIAFFFFAVAPTALLFLVSTKFLATSFETWFSGKAAAVMMKTREAGTIMYERDRKRVESLAEIAKEKTYVSSAFPFSSSLTYDINVRSLRGFARKNRIYAIRVFDQRGLLYWQQGAQGQTLLNSKKLDKFVKRAIFKFQKNKHLISIGALDVDDSYDVVRAVSPIWDSKKLSLVGLVLTEERFKTRIIEGIESIIDEFESLKPGAKLIKFSFNIILVLLVAIIAFAAIWLGFYVAREIVSPIKILAEATREVALGNYNIKLETEATDETGQLIRSFNSMILDLKEQENRVRRFTNELKSKNIELDRRRNYTEVILKNISAGVISIDTAMQVTSINSAAEKILSVNAKDITLKSYSESFDENLILCFFDPILQHLDQSKEFSGEIDLSEAGKNIILLADGIKIYDEWSDHLGYLIVFDDASEQVKVQRIAAWREVARRIAHEIKNPITPIKLSAQRLLRKFEGRFTGKDRDTFKSCIETIVEEVDSLKVMVDEFSKFSRLPSVTTQSFDINGILFDMVSFFTLGYPNVTFNMSLEQSEGFRAEIDKEQFKRALKNIITNSIQAFEEGGSNEVLIETSIIGERQMVKIEVADNGSGIPEDYKSKILEPYFSTKKQGTGLGLAIVNQIVSEHGGHLRITDNKPKGTIVVIELPYIKK